MKHQVTYGNATHLLVFEDMDTVAGWDWPSITGVTITITDHSGSVIDEIEDEAATLWDGVVKSGETPEATNTTLAVTDTDDEEPREGARYRIKSADGGVIEDIVCHSWSGSSNEYVITLKDDLTQNHTAGDSVTGCYATYELDASDTTVWTKGKRLIIIWTPTGSDDGSVRFDGVVGAYEFAGADVSDAGKPEPPDNETIRAEFDELLGRLGTDLANQLSAVFFKKGLRLYTRQEILSYHGDDSAAEYETALKKWVGWVDELKVMTKTEDTDQDGVIDQHYASGWSYGSRSP